ncbi:hypothetical protein BGW38_002863 [Lunasporangiospora selenospora]|uniref:Glutathione S-transferase n=1 Tax=Lunasporangiospora selenospora TaxID=979761 RepID=A0A9P6FS02_9FUNG|nr:hypothetical protein BGW38_002863 [Lunasporangiospora selenospora]
MAPPSLPVATQASSEVLSAVVKSNDNTYKYLYFNLHGRGELTRTLFHIAQVPFEELPVDWSVQKEQTPFQVLPVVYETSPSGAVIELAETQAIERYLARKFGFFGDNAWEEVFIDQIFNSSDTLINTFSQKILHNPPEVRVEEANKLYSDVLPKFIAVHEQHLKKNHGGNGHYVGNKVSLADLKTAQAIGRFLFLRPQGANEVPFSAEKTPYLWKVYETVNSQPGLAQFRSSARYQELDESSKVLFKFK